MRIGKSGEGIGKGNGKELAAKLLAKLNSTLTRCIMCAINIYKF